MKTSFEEALAIVRIRRATVLKTAAEARERLTLSRLVDDAAAVLDPDLTFLARLQRNVARNKLVSLAVVAGAAWLAGSSHQPDGRPPGARKVRRAKPKEKNNVSGQHKRDDRPEPGTGQRAKDARTQGHDENSPKAGRGGSGHRGQARASGGVAPVRRNGQQPGPLTGKLSA